MGILQNLGNYKFSEAGKDWGLDHFGFSLAAVNCDFDRDGDLDLFIGGRLVPGRYPLTPNSYLLLNESGTFTDITDQLAEQELA